jgi:hypothetical protein
MPTYLTPGVYVEEVSSGSKPIEGVATSVAAFVGLLPGGPINKPMRISNWTQFANIYTDPAQPENGLLPERRLNRLDHPRGQRALVTRGPGRPAVSD